MNVQQQKKHVSSIIHHQQTAAAAWDGTRDFTDAFFSDEGSIRKFVQQTMTKQFAAEKKRTLEYLPLEYRNRFHTMGYYGGELRPVQILSPYDLPPGSLRRTWLEVFSQQIKRRGGLHELPYLLYDLNHPYSAPSDALEKHVTLETYSSFKRSFIPMEETLQGNGKPPFAVRPDPDRFALVSRCSKNNLAIGARLSVSLYEESSPRSSKNHQEGGGVRTGILREQRGDFARIAFDDDKDQSRWIPLQDYRYEVLHQAVENKNGTIFSPRKEVASSLLALRGVGVAVATQTSGGKSSSKEVVPPPPVPERAVLGPVHENHKNNKVRVSNTNAGVVSEKCPPAADTVTRQPPSLSSRDPNTSQPLHRPSFPSAKHVHKPPNATKGTVATNAQSKANRQSTTSNHVNATPMPVLPYSAAPNNFQPMNQPVHPPHGGWFWDNRRGVWVPCPPVAFGWVPARGAAAGRSSSSRTTDVDASRTPRANENKPGTLPLVTTTKRVNAETNRDKTGMLSPQIGKSTVEKTVAGNGTNPTSSEARQENQSTTTTPLTANSQPTQDDAKSQANVKNESETKATQRKRKSPSVKLSRRLPNGRIRAKSEPLRAPDGTFLKPSRGPKGYDWDAMAGVWTPPPGISSLDLNPIVVAEMPSKKAKAAEKKTKTKKPRDADKPKNPSSAYNIFFKEYREKIRALLFANDGAVVDNDPASDDYISPEELKTLRQENGKMNTAEISKLIGRRWSKILPENLSRLQLVAFADRERHTREMEDYNQKKFSDARLLLGMNPSSQASETLQSPAEDGAKKAEQPVF